MTLSFKDCVGKKIEEKEEHLLAIPVSMVTIWLSELLHMKLEAMTYAV